MNEPIGCALCGGNDHNADECKRFAGEPLPYGIVNCPYSAEQDVRVVGFKIRPGDEAYGKYGLSEPLGWFRKWAAAQPAPVVPDGWRLVPERMELLPADIAAIMFHCGGDEDATEAARVKAEEECERVTMKEICPECSHQFECFHNPLINQLRAELSALKAQQVGQESEPAPKQHPDDAAVDRFAAAMKAKLARSREKGRHGWQNCTAPHLSAMLYDHLYKADPLDVGNFAMMLHQNGQAIELPFEARGRHTAPQPAPAQDVADDLRFLAEYVLGREYGRALPNYEALGRFPLDVAEAALAAHDKQSGGEA